MKLSKTTPEAVNRLLIKGIEDAINGAADAEIEKAKKRLETQIRNSLAGIAVNIAKQADIQIMGERLIITVNTKDMNL